MTSFLQFFINPASYNPTLNRGDIEGSWNRTPEPLNTKYAMFLFSMLRMASNVVKDGQE
jgi:hypothetical protein